MRATIPIGETLLLAGRAVGEAIARAIEQSERIAVPVNEVEPDQDSALHSCAMEPESERDVKLAPLTKCVAEEAEYLWDVCGRLEGLSADGANECSPGGGRNVQNLLSEDASDQAIRHRVLTHSTCPSSLHPTYPTAEQAAEAWGLLRTAIDCRVGDLMGAAAASVLEPLLTLELCMRNTI